MKVKLMEIQQHSVVRIRCDPMHHAIVSICLMHIPHGAYFILQNSHQEEHFRKDPIQKSIQIFTIFSHFFLLLLF